jgi:hypothetical protein
MLPLLRIANALITTMASGQPRLPLLHQKTTQLVLDDRAQPIDERLRFRILLVHRALARVLPIGIRRRRAVRHGRPCAAGG